MQAFVFEKAFPVKNAGAKIRNGTKDSAAVHLPRYLLSLGGTQLGLFC
ncbi:MAG TPA: hypothetical protein PLF41_04240 [Anaerolineales bacterium]|jgi:hypothetical protein|nr:hypothetical protein [Anaerolineales bacterium]